MASDVVPLPLTFDAKLLESDYRGSGAEHIGQYVTSVDGQTYVYEKEAANLIIARERGEHTFSVINDRFKGTYTEHVVEQLEDLFGVCRVRFMMLTPQRRAYSMHQDLTCRLHIPVSTNADCMFICDGELYRMPDIGRVYYANTRKRHTALNAGDTPRLHLLCSLRNPSMDYTQLSTILQWTQ